MTASDVPRPLGGWHAASSAVRLAVSVVVGLVVGVVSVLVVPRQYGPMLGWDGAAITFLLASWLVMWQLDAIGTAASATREDSSTATSDAVLLAAAVASLLSVALVLFGAGRSSGVAEALRVLLGVASVVLSWAVVHTLFCLKYARLYYQQPVGGIDFNDDAQPDYADFAYLAFTVGMTFQVSDTDIGKPTIRETVLRHALISFVFGAVIIAVTINLVAGLSK